MALHNITGKYGETLAAAYFTERGYTILHQNWRNARFEVDIIASVRETLHFIEVKTRRTRKFGLPEESVSPKKIKNLIDASAIYLYENPQWIKIQFDVLAITLGKTEEENEYFLIEDVYL